MKTKTIAELKAWLGWNWPDFFLNLSLVPFGAGFLLSSLVFVLFLFSLATGLMLTGIFFYFWKPNKSISRTSVFLNKWLSTLGAVIMLAFMVMRIVWLASR